jgi:hypothetical protein
MNAVAIQESTGCKLSSSRDSTEKKYICWKIGVMCDDDSVSYENVMSNQAVHMMSPLALVKLLKFTYVNIINIFACEADNVNF